MTEKERLNIELMVLVLTQSALRVIAFATLELPLDQYVAAFEGRSKSSKGMKDPNAILDKFIRDKKLPLTFIGIFGLKDPIRKNVNGFVQWGRNHGNLSLRMLSGDHV